MPSFLTVGRLEQVGVHPPVVDEVVRVEEEVEVLGRLGEKEGLHPVLQGVGPHVLDRRVAAGGASRVLRTVADRQEKYKSADMNCQEKYNKSADLNRQEKYKSADRCERPAEI